MYESLTIDFFCKTSELDWTTMASRLSLQVRVEDLLACPSDPACEVMTISGFRRKPDHVHKLYPCNGKLHLNPEPEFWAVFQDMLALLILAVRHHDGQIFLDGKPLRGSELWKKLIVHEDPEPRLILEAAGVLPEEIPKNPALPLAAFIRRRKKGLQAFF